MLSKKFVQKKDEKMTAIRSSTIKGVQNIRTHAGRANQSTKPYQAYFRIGALEMEKARRATERQSAMERVNTIDTRVREIETEKSGLMKIIVADRQEPFTEQNRDKKRTGKNFKIRY
jgi:hypothetical protein